MLLKAHFRLRRRAKIGAAVAAATLPQAARMPTLNRLGLGSLSRNAGPSATALRPCPEPSRMNVDVAERTERPADAKRPLHPDGPHVPRLLAAGAVGRRATGE